MIKYVGFFWAPNIYCVFVDIYEFRICESITKLGCAKQAYSATRFRNLAKMQLTDVDVRQRVLGLHHIGHLVV